MKKYLKYSGIVAVLFAIVAFILMMATSGVMYQSGSTQYNYEGILVLFGGTRSGLYGLVSVTFKPAAISLIAWILVLVAIIIILLGIILPLLKVKALDKFAGVLNLIAVAALITGGILLFFSAPAFYGANKDVVSESVRLNVGWVFAGILAIVGGCFAILPAAVDFVGKKK